MKRRFGFSLLGGLALALAGLGGVAEATHWWGGYKWAGTGSITLKIRDQVTGDWDQYLDTAKSDWGGVSTGILTFGYPDHLGFASLNGSTSLNVRRRCAAGLGEIRVCNAPYGNNGWLGLAQVWVYSDGTIAQAVAKMNDSYFSTSTYNTAPWRHLVMCQEIAHGFGLDHQDENFNNANVGSCMDYTNDPDGGDGGAVNNDPSNEHPNAHDFQELDIIYGGGPSPGGSPGRSGAAGPGAMPDVLDDLPRGASAANGVRYVTDLGGGRKLITHVFWAPLP